MDEETPKHEIVQDNIKRKFQMNGSSALKGIEKCKCSYKLSSWKHFKYHIIKTHLRNTFQCDQCDKALTEKTKLMAHIQFFDETFQFLCNKCTF